MDWNALAAVKVDDLTRTRSAGQPVNTHVVSPPRPVAPDFELMRRMVHDSVPPPAQPKPAA